MAAAARATTAGKTIAERILRGAVGGAIAGGVFIAITSWFAHSIGDPADGPLIGVLLSLAFFESGVRSREPFVALRADTFAGVAWLPPAPVLPLGRVPIAWTRWEPKSERSRL